MFECPVLARLLFSGLSQDRLKVAHMTVHVRFAME